MNRVDQKIKLNAWFDGYNWLVSKEPERKKAKAQIEINRFSLSRKENMEVIEVILCQLIIVPFFIKGLSTKP